MDQDNRQRKGNPFINFLNDSYGKYRTANFFGKGAIYGTRAMTAGSLGVTIGIIILGTIIIMVFLLSNQANSSSENLQNPSTNTQNLNGLFNFGGATTDEQNAIYGFFQTTSNYSMYQKLLTVGGPVNISFGTDPALRPGWCGGSVSNGDIAFYNYLSCGVGGQKYLFFHESGHTIANRNPDIYNLYAASYSGLVAQDGSQCYTGGFLSSYEKEFGGVAGPINESFAESVAVSLLKNWGTFNDFPTNCPATYNWFSKYVLGL